MRRKWRCRWIWERNEGMGIRIGMRTTIMKQQRRISQPWCGKKMETMQRKKCSTCLEFLQIRTSRAPTALWLMFHPSKATTPFLIKITDLVPKKKAGNTERKLLTLSFVVGCFYQVLLNVYRAALPHILAGSCTQVVSANAPAAAQTTRCCK